MSARESVEKWVLLAFLFLQITWSHSENQDYFFNLSIDVITSVL